LETKWWVAFNNGKKSRSWMTRANICIYAPEKLPLITIGVTGGHLHMQKQVYVCVGAHGYTVQKAVQKGGSTPLEAKKADLL